MPLNFDLTMPSYTNQHLSGQAETTVHHFRYLPGSAVIAVQQFNTKLGGPELLLTNQHPPRLAATAGKESPGRKCGRELLVSLTTDLQ
jgi:hypothetical protein